MNGRMTKMLRRQARKEAKKLETSMVPEFKKFVNTELNLGERLVLACRIIRKRF